MVSLGVFSLIANLLDSTLALAVLWLVDLSTAGEMLEERISSEENCCEWGGLMRHHGEGIGAGP